jgi:glycine reductase
VQIAAVVDIVKSIGTPRALRGHAITCPVGDATLSVNDEKILRRKYVEKALRMLESSANPGVVNSLSI